MFNYLEEDGNPKIAKIIGHIALAILIFVVVFGSFGTINAGYRGVKTQFGKIVGVIQPGLYAKWPIMEGVTKMNVQTLTVTFDNKQGTGDNSEKSSLFSASKDLQDVQIATVVNYHIDPSKVDVIFQQYGSSENYQTNVIEPIIRDMVKTNASLFTAEELVTRRAEFNDKVFKDLSERIAPKFAVLERVNITNFQFSDSFNKAIEAKVTAVQNAEAAKNKLEQIKFEAAQTIATAQAQAEAIRIQAQAINSQGGADYVALQAVQKWNGILPTQMIPSGAVPFLNLNGVK